MADAQAESGLVSRARYAAGLAVHLHARKSTRNFCDTECGLHCDQVDTAYRDRDPERVTCAECRQKGGLR